MSFSFSDKYCSCCGNKFSKFLQYKHAFYREANCHNPDFPYWLEGKETNFFHHIYHNIYQSEKENNTHFQLKASKRSPKTGKMQETEPFKSNPQLDIPSYFLKFPNSIQRLVECRFTTFIYALATILKYLLKIKQHTIEIIKEGACKKWNNMHYLLQALGQHSKFHSTA